MEHGKIEVHSSNRIDNSLLMNVYREWRMRDKLINAVLVMNILYRNRNLFLFVFRVRDYFLTGYKKGNKYIHGIISGKK